MPKFTAKSSKMEISTFSLTELNVLIRSRLYLQVPGLANQILARYCEIAKPNDCLGDEEFWTFYLGEESAEPAVKRPRRDPHPKGPPQGHPSSSTAPPPSAAAASSAPLEDDASTSTAQPSAASSSTPLEDVSAAAVSASEDASPFTAATADDSSSSAPSTSNSASESFVPSDYYQILELGVRESGKLRARSLTFGLRLRRMEVCPNSQQVMLSAISALIEKAFVGAGPEDKVGLLLSHPGLNKKIGIPASTREMLTAEKVIAIMEKFMQSGDDVGYDELWTIEAVRISKPQKAGRPPTPVNLTAFLEKKCRGSGCLMKIVNRDELCVPRYAFHSH